MIRIVKFSEHCCNVDNDNDLEKMLALGGVELTSDEIIAAGMAGYERLVCPRNTIICADGSIIFNAPPVAALTDQFYTSLRASRDARLTATDKYLLADYPISADALAQVRAYRAALRALPEQPGAPWDGGGDETPWPELPSVG